MKTGVPVPAQRGRTMKRISAIPYQRNLTPKNSKSYEAVDFDIPEDAKECEIKSMLQGEWHIHPKQLIIMPNGENNSGNIDIKKTTFIVVGFQAATISLKVKPIRVDSSPIIFFDVDLQSSVRQFKERAQTQVIDLQQRATELCLGDKELQDHQYLREIAGLNDGSTLLCRVHNKGA